MIHIYHINHMIWYDMIQMICMQLPGPGYLVFPTLKRIKLYSSNPVSENLKQPLAVRAVLAARAKLSSISAFRIFWWERSEMIPCSWPPGSIESMLWTRPWSLAVKPWSRQQLLAFLKDDPSCCTSLSVKRVSTRLANFHGNAAYGWTRLSHILVNMCRTLNTTKPTHRGSLPKPSSSSRLVLSPLPESP